VGDAAFADYLFMRSNPKGVHAERWRHVHGCGRWFNALRDTVSDQILAVYPMGEPRPALSEAALGPARKPRPPLALAAPPQPPALGAPKPSEPRR
jgi:sarcosine oxidase subunit delta